MKKRALILAAATLVLTGCSTFDSKVVRPLAGDGLINAVNQNTDKLALQLKESKKISYTPVLVTSYFRNEQQKACKETSLMTDLVTSRLGFNGYKVSEVKVPAIVTQDAQGNLAITEDARAAAANLMADTIVALSWTTVAPVKAPELMEKLKLTTGDKTYVTLKAIRISDNRVLGSQVFITPNPVTCLN